MNKNRKLDRHAFKKTVCAVAVGAVTATTVLAQLPVNVQGQGRAVYASGLTMTAAEPLAGNTNLLFNTLLPVRLDEKGNPIVTPTPSVTPKSSAEAKESKAAEEAKTKEAPAAAAAPAAKEAKTEEAAAAEEAKTEEAPVVEEAKTEEAPVVEEAKTEEAPAAEEAKAAEAPAAEEAKTEEAPAAEEAKTEEAPVVEEAKTEEAPAAEEAKAAEAPAAEAVKTEEAPAAEEAKTEEAPAVEAAKTEEAPAAEEAKAAEAPAAEEAKAAEAPVTPERSKTEEAQKEDAKTVSGKELFSAIKVNIGSQEDIESLLKAWKWYESASEDERASISPALLERMKKAQSAVKLFNKNSSGCHLESDLPWYVQLRVEKTGSGFDLGETMGTCSVALWDLLADEPYVDVEESIKMEVPLGDREVDDLSFGTMAFAAKTAASISHTSVAGGKVLVGPEDKIYGDKTGNASKAGSTSTGSGQAGKSQSSGGTSAAGSSSAGKEKSGSNTSASSSSDSASTSSGASKGGESGTRAIVASPATVFAKRAASVQTGDFNDLRPYIITLAVGALMMTLLIIYGRRRRK